MTETFYEKILKIVQKMTSNDPRSQDLLHDIVEQLSKNKTYNNLPENQKIFFIVRTIKNQFYSNNSKFYKEYRRYQFTNIEQVRELQNEDLYIETPSIEWIYDEFDKIIKENQDRWYDVGIFKLYIEEKNNLSKLHNRTRIPKYSLRQTLNDMKEELRKRWDKYINDNEI